MKLRPVLLTISAIIRRFLVLRSTVDLPTRLCLCRGDNICILGGKIDIVKLCITVYLI
jgi:hypothetical protein